MVGAETGDAGATAALRRVALITGGSTGIGLAVAREFAARGHDLLLIARRSARLEDVARTLTQDYPVRVHILALDVTADDAISQINRKLVTSGLTVAWLVNNAAAWLSGPVQEAQSRDLERVLNANIVAVHRLTRAVLPAMLARGRGAILNVGSLAGMTPAPGFAVYGASKAFLRDMTLALREELRGSGISVSLLTPGIVRTTFMTNGTSAGYSWISWLQSSPETVAASAYRGMLSGQAVIIPGLIWRLVWFGMCILPMRFTAWVLRAMQPDPPMAVLHQESVAPDAAVAGPRSASIRA